MGFSIDSSPTANLVVRALGMAIENPPSRGFVRLHSPPTVAPSRRMFSPPVSANSATPAPLPEIKALD
jgi:hypothetical protein